MRKLFAAIAVLVAPVVITGWLALAACSPARRAAPSAAAPASGPAEVATGVEDAGLDAEISADAESFTPMPVAESVDFDRQIRPILEARCQPCHFAGGKMHDSLPFDQPETIRTLGTKLFTRIQDGEEQALIRAFLDQAAGR